MYTLIIGNKNYSSWSLRPWILMKELGFSFTEKMEPFIEGGSWDTYRRFSPTGTVPVLVDEQENIKVWDSLAIVEYLAEKHPEVWPENIQARAWARATTAEMHSGFSAIRNQCNMTVGQRVKLHQISPELQKDINRIDEIWTEGLAMFNGDFLAGKTFTAVDAFYVPVAYRVRTYSLPISKQAQIYAERLLQLNSAIEWEHAALQEVWRESFHEKETTDAGIVLEDFRAV